MGEQALAQFLSMTDLLAARATNSGDGHEVNLGFSPPSLPIHQSAYERIGSFVFASRFMAALAKLEGI